MIKRINLKELSEKSGKAELEIAKELMKCLNTVAKETGITQKVSWSYKGDSK